MVFMTDKPRKTLLKLMDSEHNDKQNTTWNFIKDIVNVNHKILKVKLEPNKLSGIQAPESSGLGAQWCNERNN